MANRARRKERKTFSLSPESIRLIETVREERRAQSASSVLDQLLAEVRRQREQEKISNAIAAYYGSLGKKDMTEEAAWGNFADSQFPLD